MTKNIFYIIVSIVGISSLTEASTGGMLRRPTTQLTHHMPTWAPIATHAAGTYRQPTTATTLPSTYGAPSTTPWSTAMPERDHVAEMMRQYKVPTATLKPALPTLPATGTFTADTAALNQIKLWKQEFAELTSLNAWEAKVREVSPKLKALNVPQEEKKEAVAFIRQQKNRILAGTPGQTKQSTPTKPSSTPIPTPKPAKPSSAPKPTATPAQPSSEPLKNLQQSMFRKIFEWGMGKLGLGILGRAKKQAENIAFSAQSPEQLFKIMHGLNASQQEEVLNSWVQGWKANLNRHKQHTATYDAELKKFQTQLKATLAHMHKILPKSQIALLTSDNYGTDSLDHPTVKMSVLDAHEGHEVSQKVIHTQDGINVHHRETPWGEYMFSLAVEYVKNEITAYLKGQTQAGGRTTSQPATDDLNEPAY